MDSSTGATHDYCGKGHAEEGKKRGIYGMYSCVCVRVCVCVCVCEWVGACTFLLHVTSSLIHLIGQ